MIPLLRFMGVPPIETKAGTRRLQCTHKHVDMEYVRIHFDIGRFLDRSKYVPHQGKRECERRLRQAKP